MQKKKLIVMASMIMIVLCFLSACKLSGAGIEKPIDSTLPDLKIGVDNLKPFFFIDENGNYAGIDAEIAIESCNRAGYKPVFVEINWSDRYTYLQDGTVDCLWTAFVKNGRENMYQWTDTYLQSRLRVIVNKKSPDKDINAIHGRGGVAVRAGSRAEEVLLKDNDDQEPCKVYSCGTFEMAETAFGKEYASALCSHEVVLEQVMSDYSDLYRFLDGTVEDVELGVAFAKDDTSDKCEKINAALNDMKTEGVIDDIFAKYCTDVSDAGEVSDNVQK